jgi:hypothetical protein
MISHSDPLGNPTALRIGSALKEPMGVLFGENRGENSFKDLQMPLIPICVLGNIYHCGIPNVVDKSSCNCRGNVKLKSLW